MTPEEGEGTAPSSRAVQEKVLGYWDATGVPTEALVRERTGPVFRFTEGPPTANGAPHLGHLLARVIKDVELRYHRMRGERLISPMAGWDCHGLPVELEIEKRLGVKSKREIEAYGVERFCEACRASVLEVASVWQEMSRRLGYWLDYDHAYRTMDPRFIESVWWSLKTLFDRGLLEKGHYSLPYCPRCETPLSSHEVAQGYREATDPSVTLRFPLTTKGPDRRDLLVWTTTPWTLTANLLVAAKADIEYSVVRTPAGEDLVLASVAVSRYFPEGVEVIDRFPGHSLEGATYDPPFDTPGPAPGRYRVVLDDSVTTEDGTGLVHVAPSFGPDDHRIGAREKVGVFDPLDSRGVFTDLVPLVQGKAFKAADPILLKDLAARGRLFRSGTIRHTYPFCWRCGTPLIYRAIDSWFVRTSRATDRLVRHNSTVHWVPEHLRDGRFGNFLTEAKDWALSRNRYWGTPLPIWVCSAGHATCVGSFAELSERLGEPLPTPFDPHRVTVDRLSLRCATCGESARREPYTIDGWYDSGSAPFAQFHYPFEPGPFEPATPLDFVAEGLDQTRGWFYAMLVIATLLFDRPAYRTCVVNGMVLDEADQKMSKSKGNVIEPMSFLEQFGADPIRWAFLTVDFTEPMRMGTTTVQKAAARTLGTLVNATVFHLENARADRLPPAFDAPHPTSTLDRWLLSRLEATRSEVNTALDQYDLRRGASAVRTFVDDLSTWYLRRSRPRFWTEESAPDRRMAHATLSYALLGFARTIAPLLPFTAEWIFQEVGDLGFRERDRSVHLSPWPSPLAARDRELESAMDELRALVEVGRELRHRAEVKSRIPLADLVLFGPEPAGLAAMGPEGRTLLADELNVKRVRRVPVTDRAEYPDADWVVREESGTPVAALSRRPTPELLEEGLAREVARRLQQTRKELGLRYTDTVAVTVGATGMLRTALERRRTALAHDLLADPLEVIEGPLAANDDVRSWDVDGVTFSARIVRRPR
ncbi:MAG TPA: isoleucine--tRNA ligase [Thermoplasmata archaeon]|nr:isoleucine--tRNA ligase [Thermoplasmata archaeon]